jgi:proteasome lid subunit RPN8/RPN11
LDRACILSLVNSAVEVYNRETTGILVGREALRSLQGARRRVLLIEAAYPFQTADRNVTWVEPGNHRAAHRARHAVDSLGFRILGEYHSHTNNERRLSPADIEYARAALGRMNGTAPPRWLELVLSMRRKEYAAPRPPGSTWRDYTRSVGCDITTGPRSGFHVTIAGFWISRERAACEPATIHAAWNGNGSANGNGHARSAR